MPAAPTVIPAGVLSPALAATVRALEATEANLQRAERVWAGMAPHIPQGPAFGDSPAYDDLRRSLVELLAHLPAIDGWRPEDTTASLNEIGQWRLDAAEVDEPSCYLSVDEAAGRPGRDLAEYRFRFDRKRRALTREAVHGLLDEIDGQLQAVDASALAGAGETAPLEERFLGQLRGRVAQLDALLGSSIRRPPRWDDLQRHLYYGRNGDLRDILRNDWPVVKPAITAGLYGDHDPLPTGVKDLSELTPAARADRIPVALHWDRLTDNDFERLVYALICSEPAYENARWLTRTHAPDGGRDITADRVVADPLAGTHRERVVIQCRHWLAKSVAPSDVATLKEQMLTWGHPPVDVLVIATSGRFTTDAVRGIEAHNLTRAGLHIDPWPESHLERLLAERPGIIAQFQLR